MFLFMSDEMTTLAVPKEFAENLRQEYDGGNDLERLEDWADNSSEEPYKNVISVDDVEDAVSRAIERDLPEVLRNEMR